jgi:hypothetical protein
MYFYISDSLYNNIVKNTIDIRNKILVLLLLSCDDLLLCHLFIYLFLNMNSSLNKSNLHFELISSKLALIHTNHSMDIESLDSTQKIIQILFS